MVQSLKYNKSLLKRPVPFSKLKRELQKADGHKPFVGKQIPAAELEKVKHDIRTRIQTRRRRGLYLTAATTALVAVLLITMVSAYVLSNTYSIKPPTQNEAVRAPRQSTSFLISDGKKWLKKRNFHNASFQFELALKQDPGIYEGNVLLAISYLLNCQLNKQSCDNAERQLSFVDHNFPDLSDKTQELIQYYASMANVDRDSLLSKQFSIE